MKKTKLDIDYDFDFELIGVISSFKDYKLAWNINASLGVDLKKEKDIVLKFINYSLVISNYSFDQDHSTIRLLKNQAVEHSSQTHQYLVPEMKHIDYFIQIESEGQVLQVEEILDRVKQTKGVELALYIPVSELNSRENFIYE